MRNDSNEKGTDLTSGGILTHGIMRLDPLLSYYAHNILKALMPSTEMRNLSPVLVRIFSFGFTLLFDWI